MESARSYLVVIERAQDGSYGAYVPDLPGCAVFGQETPAQAKQLISEAIEVHIEGLIEDGLPVPEPVTRGEYVETAK
ncbi:MAG: type II toxin-antitoxin system HicB family antitoxin [Planctomycetaceae bacterium]|nr:type II toxin-antitoxin system HicB family antitoxin [Planctomycetaceae bacterium]